MTRTAVLAADSTAVEVVDLPSAPLTSGQVRVRVARAGINFWELMQRSGRVPVPPNRALGTEGSGVVTEAGDDVQTLAVGQRVAWSKVPGSYAEEVTGAADKFRAVPDGLDDEQAAGVLFQGVTAQYLATDTWPLGSGDSAVVTAAAGGVGLLLTRLLVHRGTHVVGATSSTEKQAAVKAAGAHEALGYDDLAADVRSAHPEGVTAVFDSVGGEVARDLLTTLQPRGAMVLYGAASGQEAPVGAGDLGAGSYYLTRTAGRDYARTPQEAAARAADVIDLAAQRVLQVQVGGVWSLDDAGQALDALASRSTVGKLLLRP